MVEKRKFITVVTPKFRMNFPKLFAAEAFEGGTPTYSVEMLIKKSDLPQWKEVQKLVDSVIKETWPKGTPSSFKHPFRDGDTDRAGNPIYEGHIFATARRKESFGPPPVFDAAKQEVIDPGEVYSGRWAKAIVSVYSYSQIGKGVGIGLQKIQLLEDDEPFAAFADKSADGFDVEEEF